MACSRAVAHGPSETDPTRAVLRLTGPAVLTSLLQTFAFLADRIMLGRHGAVSLASMQISGTVMWSAFSVFFGAMIGTVALVARRVGAGELEQARVVARAALRLAAVLGLFVGLVGSVGAGAIARAMAPDGPAAAAIIDAATDYMRVGFCCYPAVFIATAGALILNGSGDTKTTFWIGTVGNLFNIGANYVLIYGHQLGPITIPELGATGAAIATAFSYLLQCVLMLAVLRRPSCVVRATGLLRVRSDAAELDARRRLIRLSIPAIAERIVIHVGYVWFAAVVTTLGAVAMAAHQALLTLESICFLGAEGFGVAASTIVGQYLGRRDPEGSTRGGWFAAIACAGALSSCGLLIWATASWTLPVFVAPGESGEGLIAAATLAMPLLVVAQPMMALAVVLGHGLRGAGDTRSPVLAAAIGGLALRVAGAWLLAVELGLGLSGIWLATAIDWAVRSVILAVVFARGRWRTLQI
jgi:putative MATE family efflux protein